MTAYPFSVATNCKLASDRPIGDVAYIVVGLCMWGRNTLQHIYGLYFLQCIAIDAESQWNQSNVITFQLNKECLFFACLY